MLNPPYISNRPPLVMQPPINPINASPLASRFVIESSELDELAMKFVALRRIAQDAFADAGESPTFLADAQAMSKCYAELMAALGIHSGYVLSADGKRARLVNVDRSIGRTILGIPGGLHSSRQGIRPISAEVYEIMRDQALDAMGLNSAALSRKPRPAA